MGLLDQIPGIKLRIREIADEVKQEGWIDDKTYKLVSDNLESEKITIGIVGQMKYGKSSMLNALVFGDNILPSSSTPMTASLTYLTHGDEKSIEVEFYSKDDWDQLKACADQQSEAIEVIAAQELMENVAPIKGELPNLLGKKKCVPFAEILQYVGDGGKYVPVTKSLTIKYPANRLQSVNYIDTPGFNDPIRSREVRAQESLLKADVVIVLLYAQRPFDSTDKNIIFNKLKLAGAGKVVVIINKYDLLLDDCGTEEKVMSHIDGIWKKEINSIEDGTPIKKIFEEAHHIPFSSLMALLGKMNQVEIEKDEELKFQQQNIKTNFPNIKTKEDFIKWSKLPELEHEIDEIIKKEKIKILVQKPITMILGKAREQIGNIDAELLKLELEFGNLKKSKPQLEQERKLFDEVKKEAGKEIKDRILDIKEKVLLKKGKSITKLNEIKKELLNGITKNIPDLGWLQNVDEYLGKCQDIVQKNISEFTDNIEKVNEEFSTYTFFESKNIMTTLDIQLDSIISKHITYESQINHIRETLHYMLDTKDRSIELDTIALTDFQHGWFDDFFYGLTWSLSRRGFLSDINKGKVVSKIKEQLSQNLKNNDLTSQIEKLAQKLEGNLGHIENDFADAVFVPIENALKDAIEHLNQKENRCTMIEKESGELNAKKHVMSTKIEKYEKEMSSFVGGL